MNRDPDHPNTKLKRPVFGDHQYLPKPSSGWPFLTIRNPGSTGPRSCDVEVGGKVRPEEAKRRTSTDIRYRFCLSLRIINFNHVTFHYMVGNPWCYDDLLLDLGIQPIMYGCFSIAVFRLGSQFLAAPAHTVMYSRVCRNGLG